MDWIGSRTRVSAGPWNGTETRIQAPGGLCGQPPGPEDAQTTDTDTEHRHGSFRWGEEALWVEV